MIWRALRGIIPVCLVGAGLQTEAWAAETSQADKAAARALFEEGRTLAGQGRHAEACPKFEASLKTEPGVGTMFNLADCYENVGKTASAWSMYLEVAALTRADGQKDREQLARTRAKKLEPRLNKLTVDVAPDMNGVRGFVVRRDGSEVIRGMYGSAIPVDPGQHDLEATAPGRKRWEKSVNVTGEGTQTMVSVPVLEPDAAAAAPIATAPSASVQPITPAQPEQTAQGGSTLRTLGWVTLAVGAAGLVLGGVTGGMALGKKSDLEGKCTPDRRCSPDLKDDISSYNGMRTLSTVGFVIGAVGVVGGVVLIWRGGGKSEAPRKETGRLVIGPGSLAWQGRF
jgi:hypothetical protein